jgi:tetratricopeptide (TPR) repeat protein
VKRPSIIEVAAFAGIAAFLWTIISSKPPREKRDPQYRAANAMGYPSREPPIDIPTLRLRVRNDPGDAYALYLLARRYDMYGKPDRARDTWVRLLANTAELAPESRGYGRTLFVRASALRALGRGDEARRSFADAAAWYTRRIGDSPRSSTNRSLLMRLGWARQLSGDTPGARECWTAALDATWQTVDGASGGASDAGDPGVAYDRAALLCLLNRPEEGLTALTVAAARGYDDPEGALADEAFAPIRDDERFTRTIEWIRRTAVARRWNELVNPYPFHAGVYRGPGGARQL